MAKLLFSIFILTTLALSSHAGIIKSTDSVKGDSFVYKGGHLRDPYVSLASAGGGSGSLDSSAKKTPEELDEEFDPGFMVIKAKINRAAPGKGAVILGSASGTGDNYIVEKKKIKHMPSGHFLKYYIARIQGDTVIIMRAGKAETSVVTFPKQEEE